MFIDETIITVKAGNGGNGCATFLREKYKPKGPPAGGSGGNGGNIYLKGSPHLRTLIDLDFRKNYKAENGAHGKGGNKDGKNGNDIIIYVPLGTVVINEDTGEQLLDITDDKNLYLVAKGGRGGKGNAALKTKLNPAPKFAEKGKPGEQKRLRLILKIIADIGLVGRPNAGKSTFLSKISHAKPKIADYPFTTTRPYLGIVKTEDYKSFVVADIPGLIEGSHLGKGLGIKFLRHIERTKILAILIPSDSKDPIAESKILLNELNSYSNILMNKPKCFILSKSDLCEDINKILPNGWYAISSITGYGIPQIIRKFKQMLDDLESKQSIL
jgi:GTP-binding protein